MRQVAWVWLVVLVLVVAGCGGGGSDGGTIGDDGGGGGGDMHSGDVPARLTIAKCTPAQGSVLDIADPEATLTVELSYEIGGEDAFIDFAWVERWVSDEDWDGFANHSPALNTGCGTLNLESMLNELRSQAYISPSEPKTGAITLVIPLCYFNPVGIDGSYKMAVIDIVTSAAGVDGGGPSASDYGYGWDTLSFDWAADGERAYYGDSDGDGYGDAGTVRFAATQPSGYVLNSTDCDDANATVSPAATEVSGGGIDNNCNGLTDETTTPMQFTYIPPAPSPWATSSATATVTRLPPMK